MHESEFQPIIHHFPRVKVLVVGDYFLDNYLILDAALSETSLETGLEAYQVVEVRRYPGAAGTVAANLVALDPGEVHALGVIGNDGEGYELLAGLHARGILTESLLQVPGRFTPTYTKPMLRDGGQERELNRLDYKNRHPCLPAIDAQIIARLREMTPRVDAVVVADQVPERNCGVITDAVREELATLAVAYPHIFFLADSRVQISEYRNVVLKPNREEAYRAWHQVAGHPASLAESAALGNALARRNARPVFLTMSEDGILVADGATATHVPAYRQTGPIDICGAGDSTMAGITLALCSGANPVQAAVIGNLVASHTVQQIGVTGTTTRGALLERFHAAGDELQPVAVALPTG